MCIYTYAGRYVVLFAVMLVLDGNKSRATLYSGILPVAHWGRGTVTCVWSQSVCGSRVSGTFICNATPRENKFAHVCLSARERTSVRYF